MSDSLVDPIAAVQNPAFGAALLWSFGAAYQNEKIDDLPSMLLFFTVLPLVLHAPTLDIIGHTNVGSGLSLFVSKLAKRREDLVAVHERALKLRRLTLESLGTGIASRLLSIDYDKALVRANEAAMPVSPERLKRYGSAAEKVGRWCAKLPPSQTFTLLQVQV